MSCPQQFHGSCRGIGHAITVVDDTFPYDFYAYNEHILHHLATKHATHGDVESKPPKLAIAISWSARDFSPLLGTAIFDVRLVERHTFFRRDAVGRRIPCC